MTDYSVQLVSATATGVLGEYDHSINFEEGQKFRIIYGPNGVGKTKFLEILNALLNLDGLTLGTIPFKTASIALSDGSAIFANFEDVDEIENEGDDTDRQLVFTYENPFKERTVWPFEGGNTDGWLYRNTPWRPINRGRPANSQGKGAMLWERRGGGVADLSELEKMYSVQLGKLVDIPDGMANFKARVSSRLIETQRLQADIAESAVNDSQRFPSGGYRGEELGLHFPPSSRIKQQAHEMSRLINEAQTQHSSITQELDRTFPSRMLTHNRDYTPREEDIREKYQDQDNFRRRLGKVVSVDIENELSLPVEEFNEFELRMLDLYLEDAEQKLDPFKMLLGKIELLEELLNDRFLNKEIRATAPGGLKVVHTKTGNQIDLDSLSSGEQHEVILMFELLFQVDKGTLVMVDEPEISLHISWQMAFIEDVSRIAELSDFRFIVATHSPQIINDAWSFTHRLGPDGVSAGA